QLRAGEVHGDGDVPAVGAFGAAHVLDHGGPRVGFVVGAVDPDEFGTGPDDPVDEVGVGGRFARQRHHDAGPAATADGAEQGGGVAFEQAFAGDEVDRAGAGVDLGQVRE